MKSVLRVLEDEGKFYVASTAFDKPLHLGPFDSLEDAMKCLDKKGDKKCKSGQAKSTKKTTTGTETSK